MCAPWALNLRYPYQALIIPTTVPWQASAAVMDADDELVWKAEMGDLPLEPSKQPAAPGQF